MRVGLARRFLDLRLGRARFSVGDVLPDGSTEEKHLLGNHRHLRAQRRQRIVARVPAVDQQPARRRIVEAKQQGNERGLAGAARSDQRDALSRSGGEIDAVEHLDAFARRIGEADAFKADIAVEARKRRRGVCGETDLHLTGFAEELAHALSRADGLLQLAVELGELAHRSGHERRVEDEAGEFAERDLTRLQQPRPRPQHEHDGAEQGEDDEGDEGRAQPGAAQGDLQEGGEPLLVAAEFVAFVGEGLHVDDALERLLHHGRGVGQLVLRFTRDGARLSPEEDGDDGQHRQADEHDARQLERRGGDERDAADQQRDLPEELREQRDQRVLDLGEIG